MYRCTVCKKKKPKSKFHSNYGRASGITTRCKTCDKIYQKKRDRNEYFRKYRAENGEKLKAKYKLQYAVRKGNIKRGQCEVCGQPNAEAHHDDYSKPFSVRWFCRVHHMKVHRHHHS